jgi:amidase
LFDEALARASYCDGYLAREGKTLGPFHGLPISLKVPKSEHPQQADPSLTHPCLKDSFDITGLRSTIGYVDFLKREPASENSALAQILLSQGAVLYVKTNVPQTLMVMHSILQPKQLRKC